MSLEVKEKDSREIGTNNKKQSFVEKQKEKVAIGMVQSASTEISESWFKNFDIGFE